MPLERGIGIGRVCSVGTLNVFSLLYFFLSHLSTIRALCVCALMEQDEYRKSNITIQSNKPPDFITRQLFLALNVTVLLCPISLFISYH
ncbi:hypothetical protein BDF14DRAFT_1785437 [Spinellus fusiger]|nr:hypothetical protein BDF14DRAFT_1785437 [Spinellus fusiger]